MDQSDPEDGECQTHAIEHGRTHPAPGKGEDNGRESPANGGKYSGYFAQDGYLKLGITSHYT
jgi:hypothetical protein